MFKGYPQPKLKKSQQISGICHLKIFLVKAKIIGGVDSNPPTDPYMGKALVDLVLTLGQGQHQSGLVVHPDLNGFFTSLIPIKISSFLLIFYKVVYFKVKSF